VTSPVVEVQTAVPASIPPTLKTMNVDQTECNQQSTRAVEIQPFYLITVSVIAHSNSRSFCSLPDRSSHKRTPTNASLIEGYRSIAASKLLTFPF
jgi:hypothetical protein